MKAEDPMAMMREAHRELSASCRKQKTIRKTLQMVLTKFIRLEVRTWRTS